MAPMAGDELITTAGLPLRTKVVPPLATVSGIDVEAVG